MISYLPSEYLMNSKLLQQTFRPLFSFHISYGYNLTHSNPAAPDLNL